jgi:hypothetical protein
MTDDRSLERAARSWLDEGPSRAPDRTVEAALSQIQTTPQERDLGIPWRFPKMNPMTRIATALVVVALALGGVYLALKPTADVGPPPPTIEGTWEAQYTRAQMLAAGIVQDEDGPENYGHFVLTFEAGRWSHAKLDAPQAISSGTYALADGTLAFTLPGEATFPMPITVSSTTLTFGHGGPTGFRVVPWTRVSAAGPLPSGALTLEPYRAGWKSVCQAAVNAAPLPNMELWGFDRLFDPAMSATDRALSLEVGRGLAARLDGWADQLQSLNPPPDLAEDHLAYVTRFHGVAAIIRKEVDALASGDLTGARALDESTGPITLEMARYVGNWGLEPCP